MNDGRQNEVASRLPKQPDASPRADEKCFAFVIPVRNPLDQKVNDYRTIEALLEMTVSSLLRQTHSSVAVIIVCHAVPSWAEGFDDRVHFLDVSNEDVFGPDQNHVVVDKGLKYTIGVLYARARFDPELIMLLDADDYVNITLADHLLSLHDQEADIDGYLITKGVHVGTSVGRDYKVTYKFAVVVDDFDQTCGSCRVFDARRLARRLHEVDATIEERFSDWLLPDERHGMKVDDESIRWLATSVESTKEERGNIINLLGRHLWQRRFFKLVELALVGAAKSCGHGNHDGPREGAAHWHRASDTMRTSTFLSTFGLPPQRWSSALVARFRAKAADKRAGRVWADK